MATERTVEAVEDWRTVLPGLATLSQYRREWLRTDVMAGLTVGAMLVPQSMAYAELAGLPAQSGFFAALLPPVVHALFGSSRHLGVGPEPETAVLAAAGVAALAAGDAARYALLMPALALLVGVIAVLASLFRLGFLAQLLSKPVLVGYITGVGLTLLSSQIVPTALGIALVGYTDNVLTGRSIGAKHGYSVEPNQELAALGTINLASAISGGFPVSSSASRTAVRSSLKSKTQLVGLIASAFLLATLLLLAPTLARIPQASLAAVIVAAAIAIIDVPGYRSLWKVSHAEFTLALVTALSVMVFDLLTGVLLAVGLSVLITFAKITVPHDAIVVRGEGLDGWIDADHPEAGRGLEGLLVYRFDAPLFFANAERFRARLLAALEHNPGDEVWVVLDFEGVGAVDATALEMLEGLSCELREKKLTIAVARANHRALDAIERAGLLGPEGIVAFATINSAVRAFQTRAETASTDK